MTHEDGADQLLGSHNMLASILASLLATLQFILHIAARENKISVTSHHTEMLRFFQWWTEI